MDGDFYDQVNGVREPDPTLGKNVRRRRAPACEVEPVPPAPDLIPAEPEQHVKPRRQRVVLADPRRPTTSLRTRVELEEQTSWGELLIKDLVKAQFRTGLWLALLVAVVLGALPMAFFFSPTFAAASVIGVPVAWLLLGVVPFPLMFGVGLWYNRRAERHERDFVDMIEN